jgi:hypothetical protein
VQTIGAKIWAEGIGVLDFIVKLLSGLFFGFWLMVVCVQIKISFSKHKNDYKYWNDIEKKEDAMLRSNPELYEMIEKYKTMRTIVIYLICSIFCMFITDIFYIE